MGFLESVSRVVFPSYRFRHVHALLEHVGHTDRSDTPEFRICLYENGPSGERDSKRLFDVIQGEIPKCARALLNKAQADRAETDIPWMVHLDAPWLLNRQVLSQYSSEFLPLSPVPEEQIEIATAKLALAYFLRLWGDG